MADLTTRRTGAALRTGPLRAARSLLAEPGRSGDDREQAATRVAVGHLLRQDGLRGLSHPTDPRLVRPGLLGTVVGLLVACVFTGVALAVLGVTGVGPLSGDEVAPAGGPGMPSDADWSMGWPAEEPASAGIFSWFAGAFVVLGGLFVLTMLLALGVRLRCVVTGTRLVRQGRRGLAARPGGGGSTADAEAEALERVYPRFAGMLSWTLPRRSGHGTLHDDDPFD